MSDTVRPQPTITYGILSGCCLGIMEAAISIWMWRALGRPAYFYREEDLVFCTCVFVAGGIAAGFVFGLIVNELAERSNGIINMHRLYLKLVGLGALLYSVGYWLLFMYKVPTALFMDITLFVIGIVMSMKCLSRTGTTNKTSQWTVGPTACHG